MTIRRDMLSPEDVSYLDRLNQQAEEESESVSEPEEIEELVLFTSDEGPMTTAGVLLRALPGTEAGKAGWYHGIDGRPMRWDGPQ